MDGGGRKGGRERGSEGGREEGRGREREREIVLYLQCPCKSYRVQARIEVERLRWREESEPLATLKLYKEVKRTVVVSMSDEAFSANP